MELNPWRVGSAMALTAAGVGMWLHYVEESEISNLDAPRKNAACRNRAPVK